jgi:hypothetical protein
MALTTTDHHTILKDNRKIDPKPGKFLKNLLKLVDEYFIKIIYMTKYLNKFIFKIIHG